MDEMNAYEPELKHILKEDKLKPTEETSYNGCGECNAGYLSDGIMCICMRHEMKLRRYRNCNISYEYASLPLIEEDIRAFLKDDEYEHPTDPKKNGKYQIVLNPFLDDYIDNLTLYKQDGKGIIFNGPVGRGKSLSAMKLLMKIVDKGYTGYFTTIKEFLEIIKKSWDDEDYKKLLDKIYNADFVVFDDLGTELHKTDWTITEIDSFFRHRYYKKLVTIMTTNSKFEQLEAKYAQRIISLFQERSLVVSIVSEADYRPKLGKIPKYTNKNKFMKGDN